MKVIKTIFETNSSTTHSVVVMPKEKFDKWTSGLYYFNGSYYDSKSEGEKPVKGGMYTEKQVLEFLSDIGFKYDTEEYSCVSASEYIKDCDVGFISWESWFEGDYLETDKTYYTTPNGEEIVICCKYGYDG